MSILRLIAAAGVGLVWGVGQAQTLTVTGPDSLAEGDVAVRGEYTVTRSGAAFAADTTVMLEVAHTTTDADDLIVPAAVTFAAGEDMQTFTVTVVGDDISESTETFSIATSGDGAGAGVTPLPLTHAAAKVTTITDDDDIALGIRAPTRRVGEGEVVDFALTLGGASASATALTVAYTPSGATATDDNAGSITIPANTAGVIRLAIPLSDERNSGSELLTVTLDSVSGAPPGGVAAIDAARNSASATVNYHPGAHVFNFAEPVARVSEAGDDGTSHRVITYTVTRVGPDFDSDIVVGWSLTHGNTEGADFTGATSGDLTFAAADNEAAQTFVVTVNNDALNEAGENFILSLSASSAARASNGGLALAAPLRVFIEPSDAATYLIAHPRRVVEARATLNFSLRINPVSEGEVVIPYVITGSASAGTDYTAPSGTVTIPAYTDRVQLLVDVLGDNVDEETEFVIVTLTEATDGRFSKGAASGDIRRSPTSNVGIGIIRDNDTRAVRIAPSALAVSESGAGEYRVSLATQPTATVTVTPSNDNAAAASLTPVGALTFTADNWAAAQAVVVAGVDDANAVDDTAVVSFTVAGGDYAALQAAAVTVTVADDDAAGVKITPTAVALSESGAGNRAEYTVALNSAPAADVTVTPSRSNPAATVSAALTFTPMNWNTAQTVVVTGANDDNAVNDVVSITHAVDGGGDYAAIEAATVTATVGDDDTPNVEFLREIYDFVEDTRAPPVLFVIMETQPSAPVTLTATFHYNLPPLFATIGFLTRDTLTFTPDNWRQLQRFEFRIEEDVDAGSNPDIRVSVAVSTEAEEYKDFNFADTTVRILENEVARLRTTPQTLTLNEGEAATYSVSLDTNPHPDYPYIVTFESSAPAIATVNHALTFTADNWRTPQPVTVTAADDADAIAPGAVDITTVHSGEREFPNPAFDPNNPASSETISFNVLSSVDRVLDTVRVTVVDTDIRGVAFSATSLRVDENGDDTYRVALTTQPTAAVTVTPMSDDTAAVSASPAALTFTTANWNTAQTVRVSGVDDADTNAETATITHTVAGGDYAAVTAAAVTVTVTDDDVAGVRVTPRMLSLVEGGGEASESATGFYTLALNSVPAGAVTVTPMSDDAAAGVSPAALTFTTANFNTAQTVTVVAVDDANGADATATISHTVAGYGTVTTAAAVTAVIRDDEVPAVTVSETALSVEENATATYTIVLDVEPSAAVQVTPDSSDLTIARVSATLVFTAGDWNTPQTVVVTGAEGGADLGGIASITHSVVGAEYDGVLAAGVRVTVRDDTMPGVVISSATLQIAETESGEYGVTLTAPPSPDLTVTPMSSDSTTAAVSAALTFTSGNWNTEQRVTVTAIDDADAVADDEVTITHAVAGGGAPYADITAADVRVTVTDDETAEVRLSVSALSIGEGEDGTYTVRLTSEPSASVTITPAGGGSGSAVAGISPGALTFTASAMNWNMAQTITVTARVDADAIPNDPVVITHTVAGGDYSSVDAGNVTVTVTVPEGDTAAVEIAPTTLTVPEDGMRTYTVTLTSAPATDATVTPSGADPAVATFAPAALTFSAANWDSAQTVTVAGVEDADALPAEPLTIAHAVAGYAGASAITTAEAVTVTVAEGDTAAVEIAPTTLAVLEGEAGIYTVTLTSAPIAAATVTPSGSDAAVATVTPAALTFTAANWAGAQTVTVAGVQDPDAIADAPVTIAHAVAGYAGASAITTAEDVVATVAEDDVPRVEISPNTLAMTEGEARIYTVVLSSAPAALATVTPGGGAPVMAVATFSTAALIFSAANWNTAQTVTVTGVDDADAIPDDPVTIAHAVANYAGADATAEAVTVTVAEGDTAAVEIMPTTLTVLEGAVETYTVALTSAPAIAATVTPGGGDSVVAVVGVSPAALTFTAANWDSAQTVTVAGVEDDDAIPDDPVMITHAVAGYAGASAITTAEAVTATVTENDMAGVEIAPTTLAMLEGEAGIYTVVLTSAPAIAATVTPSGGDPAVATFSPAALMFSAANWDTAQTVTVSGVDDADAVPAEAVTIAHAVAGYAGASAVTTAEAVTVTVAESDMAGVEIAPTTLTVLEGGMRTYTVALTSAPLVAATVTPSGSDAEVATVSPAALTFTAANWDSAQTVTVAGVEDDDAIPDDPVMITHAVAGYAGASPVTTAETVTATVTENDMAGVLISPTTLIVREGGIETYTVTLTSAPAVLATVTPSSGDAAVTVATVSPAALTFSAANWDRAQTVTVAGVEDDDAIPDAPVMMTHAVAGYAGASPVTTAPAVTVTVAENDTAAVEIAPTALALSDSDSGIYTVALTSAPAAATLATVTPRSANPAVASVSPAALTFSAANWDRAQTVTVLNVANAGNVPDEPVRITHAVAGYAGASAVTTAASVLVTLSVTGSSAALNAVSAVVTPEVLQSMGLVRATAVVGRISQVGGGGGGVATPSFNMAGQSTLAGMVASQAQTSADDGMDMQRLLGASDFVLPLSAADGGGGSSQPAFWGGGDYRELGAENVGENEDIDWEGDQFSVNLGFDARVRPNLLAGLMISYSEADIDYTRAPAAGNAESGNYQLDLTSAHPYLSWSTADGRGDWWVTAGYGEGDLVITPEDADGEERPASNAEVTMKMAGIGGSHAMLESGGAELRFKVEGLVSQTDVVGGEPEEGAAPLADMTVHASQMRVAFETKYSHITAAGGRFEPSVELGVRNDTGDGIEGAGAEVGIHLRYQNASGSLKIETHARTLLDHEADYEDWGIGGSLRLQPGADQQGLSLTLSPHYGNLSGNIQDIWDNGVLSKNAAATTTTDNETPNLTATLTARIAYGLPTPNNTTLTPYTELTLTQKTKTYRMGMDWDCGKQININLFTQHSRKENENFDVGVWLEGVLWF